MNELSYNYKACILLKVAGVSVHVNDFKIDPSMHVNDFKIDKPNDQSKTPPSEEKIKNEK
jgi:hypothetical protein